MLDDYIMQERMHQYVAIFVVGLLISALTGFIAWKRGFFDSFSPSFYPKIKGTTVLKGFTVFILAELVVMPALFVVAIYLWTGHVITTASPSTRGWLHALVILGGFLSVVLVYVELPKETRRQMWNQTSLPWYHQLLMGVQAWFLSYPWVVTIGQLLAILVLLLFHQPALEQVAVKHFKNLLNQPFLFALTAFEVVFLVPFVEEFLFRGLLQSWLKSKMHQATGAILLTSLLFALFHYAGSQGVTNIELLSSLYLLSCLLGFIYEKQRSLWASIGLHAFFNLISILLIFREGS